MRYGLTLVPVGAFPQNVDLKLRLQDEPGEAVIEVPEDCPEVPAPCSVDCKGWTAFVYGPGGAYSDQAGMSDHSVDSILRCYPLDPLIDPDDGTCGVLARYFANSLLFAMPTGRFCGHRTNIVVDTSHAPNTDVTVRWGRFFGIPENPNNGDAFVIVMIGADGGAETPDYITVQAQIDLTDAEAGAETWTDMCAPLKMSAHISG